MVAPRTNPAASNPARAWAAWLALAGIGAFIVLYFYAAALYPGGNRFDHRVQGFSHLANYWCDLLEQVAFSGSTNPGRPFAILATVLLPLSLVPFWIQVPVLFRPSSVLQPLVRIAGPAAMMFSILVFSARHDLAINIASVFGFIALTSTLLGLVSMRRAALAALTLVPLGLAGVSYLMWQTGDFPGVMPVVQKMAFAAFFLWIAAASRAICKNSGSK